MYNIVLYSTVHVLYQYDALKGSSKEFFLLNVPVLYERGTHSKHPGEILNPIPTVHMWHSPGIYITLKLSQFAPYCSVQ